MKSETIRTRLASIYSIITTDEVGERTFKEFDTLQDAYVYGTKLLSTTEGFEIELCIQIENTSDDSGSNIVKDETIYLR